MRSWVWIALAAAAAGPWLHDAVAQTGPTAQPPSGSSEPVFTPLTAHRDGHGRTLALVRAQPRTGRTHQIRVHLLHLGSPLLGDPVYGRSSEIMPRHALHAQFLDIPHPVTRDMLHLHAPVPDDLLEAWVALGGSVPTGLEEP